MKSLALASDDAGAPLRAVIARHLAEKGIDVVEYGYDESEPLYPEIAHGVAVRIAAGEHDRGILVCGTGIGMSIVANKVPGVYAALAHDTYSAERARKSNDAQILTMGARVVGPELAKQIVDAWLASEFEPERSGPKLDAIRRIEQESEPGSA